MKKQTPPLAPEHLRFAVLAVDVALFSVCDKQLLVRTMPVNRPPHFPDHRALPGGIVAVDETAEEAALRIATERGAIDTSKIYIEQLHTFSAIERDPRGRVVAVAYLALVPWESLSASERDDSGSARWTLADDATGLAYDHDQILAKAIERLRSRITYSTLIQKLLPSEFTLTELQTVYETVLGRELDKRNFRKKIDALDIVKPLGRKRTALKARPAELYEFSSGDVVITPQL
ncbi:hypothetical protein FJY94_05785 [Candidatus Kaiserbacteria bacterium]|nr:hypothetical protein [Candidatus Kaiserbacteria bacterium]